MQRVSWRKVLHDPARGAQFEAEMRSGRICAVPTDTVYGFLVDADCPDAVNRLYELKGRIAHKPFILFLAGPEALADLGIVPSSPLLTRLIQAAWPGPVTIIFDRPPLGLKGFAHASLGVRVPAHADLRTCLRRYSGLLLSTSANRSGGEALSSAEDIAQEFQSDIDWLIEEERPAGGCASTVIDGRVWPPAVFRQGPWHLPRWVFEPDR